MKKWLRTWSTRSLEAWKKKRIPRRDGIQKTRRTMWTRRHTRSIKTNSSNEPISLRSTLGSIYLSIYLASILAGLSDRDHRTRGSTSFPLPSSLSLSFLLPFFLSPWGAGNTEHGNVHTGPTREQPRPNGATELGWTVSELDSTPKSFGPALSFVEKGVAAQLGFLARDGWGGGRWVVVGREGSGEWNREEKERKEG